VAATNVGMPRCRCGWPRGCTGPTAASLKQGLILSRMLFALDIRVRTVVFSRVMYGVHRHAQGTTTLGTPPLYQLVHIGHPLNECCWQGGWACLG
jgi:hypothetical protein